MNFQFHSKLSKVVSCGGVEPKIWVRVPLDIWLFITFCSGLRLGYCLGVGPVWAVTAFIKARSWSTIPSWLCCCSIFWCLWSHSFTWCYTLGAALSFFDWLAPRTSLERLLTIGGSFSPCRQGFNRVWPLSLIGTALKRRYLPLDTRGTIKYLWRLWRNKPICSKLFSYNAGFTLWVMRSS